MYHPFARQQKILDSFKVEQFTDNKLRVTRMIKFDNVVGKG